METEVTMQNAGISGWRTCEHIKDNDARCNQPALKGEIYCRFHVRVRSHVSPEDALYELPVLETHESVQIALQHMMGALLRGKLSERKAAVMLSSIKTAANLLRQPNQKSQKKPAGSEKAVEDFDQVIA